MPEVLRDQLYYWSPPRVRALKRRVVAAFERDADHNDIYDDVYYGKFVEPTTQMSAATMAHSIATAFSPRRVIDVGCGTGVLLEELRRCGISVLGLELADAAIARCIARGLEVYQFDIEQDKPPRLRADVVVSTEVAEHLPAFCADRFVDIMVSLADIVVLTAAAPGLGGTDHVNEQPNVYWIEKFEARGARFDEALSTLWRSRWKHAGVAACFWSSVMVFRIEESREH